MKTSPDPLSNREALVIIRQRDVCWDPYIGTQSVKLLATIPITLNVALHLIKVISKYVKKILQFLIILLTSSRDAKKLYISTCYFSTLGLEASSFFYAKPLNSGIVSSFHWFSQGQVSKLMYPPKYMSQREIISPPPLAFLDFGFLCDFLTGAH